MENVIIVGGGVAGLTAGIYCRKYGISCKIFEKHSEAGGNLTGWWRNGAYIDNCIHWLTGTLPGNQLHDIWLETGMLEESTEVYRANVFCASRLREAEAHLYADLKKTEEELIALSPDDSAEILRFLKTVKAMVPYVANGNIGEKAEMLLQIPNLAYYRRTTLFRYAIRFRHRLLQLLFTDYIGGECSVLALLFAYATFVSGNGSVPMGGSLAAAKRMRDRFLFLGGKIQTGEAIAQIAYRGDRVCGVMTEKGEYESADAVIAACDPTVTFGDLLPQSWMPKELQKRLHTPDIPIFSALHCAFLCDSAVLPAFGTLTVDSPYYSARSDGRLVLREYSHEKGFAPEGKTVVQAMTFQSEQESLNWIDLKKENPESYRNRKTKTAESMKQIIMQNFPQVKDSIEVLDVWTPATYRQLFGANAGAFLTYAMTPQTPLSGISPRVPELKGVFLATQWLRTPGGLPTAARAGISAVRECKMYLEKTLGLSFFSDRQIKNSLKQKSK